MKKVLMRILLVVFIAVFAFSAYKIIDNIVVGQREQAAFDNIADRAGEDLNGLSESQRDAALLRNYAKIHAQNSDFAAWIRVPNTNINYPVMYTPEEPDYYLRRDFNGDYAVSGTPFIGEGSKLDGDSIIVYGHNMKNKTMFGTLDNYLERDFWQANQEIEFDTLNEIGHYRVFAAVRCNILQKDEEGFRYYRQVGDLSEAEYNELVSWLCANSEYDTKLKPENREQILILSTCSYHTADGRFIIAAYKE